MLTWKAGILELPNSLSSCVFYSVSSDLSYTPERCLFGQLLDCFCTLPQHLNSCLGSAKGWHWQGRGEWKESIVCALFCPWDFPGKNTGSALPFPSPGDLYQLSHQGGPFPSSFSAKLSSSCVPPWLWLPSRWSSPQPPPPCFWCSLGSRKFFPCLFGPRSGNDVLPLLLLGTCQSFVQIHLHLFRHIFIYIHIK